MPKIFDFDDAWYRNESRNAEGEPQPLDVGYCVFKPEQVRFLTAKERHAANEPFEAALANDRLAGPFPTEEEAHSMSRPKNAYERAGDAAFAKALAEGKERDEAGSIAMKAASAARDAEEAKKPHAHAPEVVEPAPEPKVEELAPVPEPVPAPVPEPEPELIPAVEEPKVEEPAPVAGGDMFDDDEPATDPAVKPAAAPAPKHTSHAHASSSSKKKGK